MYKLSQIYNEIKLFKNISPEEVNKLWIKVDNILTSSSSINLYLTYEYYNLFREGGKFESWKYTNKNEIDWLKSLSKQEYYDFYSILLKLFNEVKLK